MRAKRTEIYEWADEHGREVAVTEVELERGRVFEVRAHFPTRGPVEMDGARIVGGLELSPARYETREIVADHYYHAATLELARAIAQHAEQVLRGAGEPNLQKLAAELKRRDRGLQTLTRDAHGATILGDTAPDEAAPGVP